MSAPKAAYQEEQMDRLSSRSDGDEKHAIDAGLKLREEETAHVAAERGHVATDK